MRITREEREEKREWMIDQATALEIIQGTVSNANDRLITGKTAKEAWEILAKEHNRQDAGRQFQFMTTLLNTYQRPDETLPAFYSRILNVTESLEGPFPSTATAKDVVDILVAALAITKVQGTSENINFTRSLLINGIVAVNDVSGAFSIEQRRRDVAAAIEATKVAKASISKARPGALGSPTCAHCSNRHNPNECWKMFPEKKPEWVRLGEKAQYEVKRLKANGKKKHARHTKVVAKDESSESEIEEPTTMASSCNFFSSHFSTDHNWGTGTRHTLLVMPRCSSI
ncbi:hypothetical protein FRB94_007457 [Tulasnella sp. JGI-2019a]|nr:hypothetical protein FRB94_007457 [Tulasnella sp. JGI-2019a]